MKNDKEYTDKEIESWCNVFDQEIVINLWECFMVPENVPFKQFLKMYQNKHKKKYGKELI